MFRSDDTTDEFMMGIIAQLFYVLAAMMLIGAVVMRYSILIPLLAGAFGGVFHFIKVTTDGRVRNRSISSRTNSKRNG